MRFLTIDVLRGSAAMAVVLYHAQGFWRRSQMTFFDGQAGALFETEPVTGLLTYLTFGLGFLGVQLFFVVSGFCIHYPFAASKRGMTLAPFGVRRFWRLYPAYAVTVLIAFAMEAAKTGFGNEEATLANLFGNLIFWYHSFPPQTAHTPLLVVFWSLTVEVQFYVLYAFVLTNLRRLGIGRVAIAWVLVGVVYTVMWQQWEDRPLPFFSPHNFGIARFGEWLLGAWIAERAAGGRPFLKGFAATAQGFGMVGAGVVLLLASVVAVSYAGGSLRALDIPGTVSFALILAGLVHWELGRGEPRPHAVVTWLSDRSYSLYLLHFVVLATGGEAYARLRRIADKESLGYQADWALITLVGVVGTLVAADLLYRFVERPSHQRARRVRDTTP